MSLNVSAWATTRPCYMCLLGRLDVSHPEVWATFGSSRYWDMGWCFSFLYQEGWEDLDFPTSFLQMTSLFTWGARLITKETEAIYLYLGMLGSGLGKWLDSCLWRRHRLPLRESEEAEWRLIEELIFLFPFVSYLVWGFGFLFFQGTGEFWMAGFAC